MGFFGGSDDIDDAALIRAARQRILAELGRKGASAGQSQRIINNVYGGAGGGGGGSSGGGLMERLGGSPSGSSEEDPFDYLVDIERKNTPEGWTKKVHRYREPKGKKKAK